MSSHAALTNDGSLQQGTNAASVSGNVSASGSRDGAMLPPSTIADGTVRSHPFHDLSAHASLHGGTVLPAPPPPFPSFATSNFPLNVVPPHNNSSTTMPPPPPAVAYPQGTEKALPPPPPRSESSPPSFPWRSGKWLPAEEHYALLLIALFERGLIADGRDGTTTLRTYLSQKLHCQPMRISKKFAGRGIGKLVYSSSSSSKPSLEPHKVQELLERLRVAEQLFLQAAYPPPVAASLGAPSFPLLSVPPSVAQPLPIFPTVMPGMVATGALSSAGDALQAQHTKELHESYLRALQQADDETPNRTASSLMPPPMQVVPMVPPTVAPPAEIPDLLSGFEKVVQKNHSLPVAPSVPLPAEGEYSPPFTSRSFDEFHRFLGKEELPLLDAPSSPPEAPPPVAQPDNTTVASVESSIALPPVTIPDTAALFTAESYAMLAQASAMEASRHGAYAMPLPLLPSGLEDVDQVLQQVGVHHPQRRHHPEPLSPHTSIRTIVDVRVQPHSMHRATTTDAAVHVTATSRAEGNIVSGSEPSGSSSSRSNTDNTSSGSDTTGTNEEDEEDGSDGIASGYTSSGGDSSPDDDDDEAMVPPPRKKNKGMVSRGEEKPKRVQFQ